MRLPSSTRICALAVLLSAVTVTAREQTWLVLENCSLKENESNDADSFHVKAGGKNYIFRLYFVDAPETEESFPGRVEEQAKYFGITSAQTIELGELAKKFVDERLSKPFTVRTRKQEGLGRSKKPRYYAFIGTSDGDLGELLVANGLARVHGVGATPLGISSPEIQERKLERLEREAKQLKLGGWGAPSGRMTARLAKRPATSGPDSFDAFFHPERVATSAPRDPNLTPPTTQAPVPAVLAPSSGTVPQSAELKPTKLDPNTATAEELMKIKGIGPVLAGRIIDARPYKSADELQKAKGIGPKKYEQIRAYFE